MADVLVLGAGPAGLAAAWRASLGGHRVTVLERGQTVGGLSASFEVAGIRVDHGSHRLHPTIAPHILSELRRLLGTDLQTRRRNGRISIGGRLVGFPLRPGDALRRLPPAMTAGLLRDAATRPLRRARRDTFADVLWASLGPAMCERFYFPYARKIWGLEPDQIAGDQARTRVSAASPVRILRKMLSRTPAGNTFFYPRRGFGQIWESIAADAAIDLRLNATVERVEGTRVTTGGETFESEHVWSTLPLPVLTKLAGGPESALRARSMVLVYLALPVDRATPYDAHYLPEAWTPVTRISEPKNYRTGDDPTGHTVLCAEIPCDATGELWTSPDATLADTAVEALRRARICDVMPDAFEVRRVSGVYPVYDLQYGASVATLERWAAAQPGLLTFGRQGLFVHDNSHHALAMGWAAAATLHDPASWTGAREAFRSHVVED